VPGKSTRRRAPKRKAEPQVAAAVAADGIMANAIDRIFENPAMSGGLVVMVITAMAIMSNALFLQHGQHPEPLFSTRPASLAAAPPPAAHREATPQPMPVPLPRTREAAATAPAAAPAPARPAAKVAPVAPAPAPDSAAALITSVQRELARLGLYTGAIDGLTGPQTRAAISAWQNAAGIPATGEATPELLLALQKPTASIAPAPVAPVVTVDKDAVAAAVQRAEELEREQAAMEGAQSLRKVQVALSEMGYGPLPTDGHMDRATSDALRGFQLDNGLAVTGENSDAVMKRLVSIGAMKAN
jgi:peptidoglycan hydrolase-like protein with peptidoglycan-binding domain